MTFLPCIGCVVGHLANARVLLEEARKFESLGNSELMDKHLFKAMGELRQSYEQHPIEEERKQLREIWKLIEGSVAENKPIPDVSSELEWKGIKALNLLREKPELCPTCRIAKEVLVEVPTHSAPKHEAIHSES